MCDFNAAGWTATGLLAAFLLILLKLVVRQWTRRNIEWRIAVQHEAATEAAKLLKDWCAWLATISTAAIAANGFLAPLQGTSLCGASALAVLSIMAFIVAIIATATLLLALPSIVARFDRENASLDNDFYEAQSFMWASTSVSGLLPLFRVGFIAGLQYLCFVIGSISFALHAALRYAN